MPAKCQHISGGYDQLVHMVKASVKFGARVLSCKYDGRHAPAIRRAVLLLIFFLYIFVGACTKTLVSVSFTSPVILILSRRVLYLEDVGRDGKI
jgi:hypothetical protein